MSAQTVELSDPFDATQPEAAPPVLAALHLDSRHVEEIMAAARARQVAAGGELVVFSVITQSSIGHALTRLQRTLAALPYPTRLVATRIASRRLTRSARAAAIGAEIVDAAHRVGAQTVVLGRPLSRRPGASDVRRAVVSALSADIDLVVTPPYDDDLGEQHRTNERRSPAGRSAARGRLVLVPAGRTSPFGQAS